MRNAPVIEWCAVTQASTCTRLLAALEICIKRSIYNLGERERDRERERETERERVQKR